MSAQIVLVLQLGLLFVNCILLIVSLTIYFHYRNNKRSSEDINQQYALQAQQEAQKVIEAAVGRAKQILAETNYVRSGLFADLERALQQAASQDINAMHAQEGQLNQFYMQLLNSIKQEHLRKTDESIKHINDITQSQMEDFRQILKKEAVQAEDLVVKRINNEYTEVHKQLEEYKKQKLAQIDTEVKTLIMQTTERILGKTLPIEEHEKLIILALEQAKADGLWNLT